MLEENQSHKKKWAALNQLLETKRDWSVAEKETFCENWRVRL